MIFYILVNTTLSSLGAIYCPRRNASTHLCNLRIRFFKQPFIITYEIKLQIIRAGHFIYYLYNSADWPSYIDSSALFYLQIFTLHSIEDD
jgi:hypothetical protein